MNRVPPGQKVTTSWPVLHYGGVPATDLRAWDLRVGGLCLHPLRMTWETFIALPRAEVKCDIHCVTTWSRLDNLFEGVAAKTILDLAEPLPSARFVILKAERGFTANLPLADFARDNVLLATHHDGAPLAPEHGGPLRAVVPHLYFWKSAKWLRGIEFRADDEPGFWERAGYHMRGDPWKEERFRGD